ncbi:MAG: family 78 glycoside hydrolase catalytic domain [Terracidiphilus sp.]|nr:family 78 glycoside hydrolase catalytic domain [Terracidiphilus sp.]
MCDSLLPLRPRLWNLLAALALGASLSTSAAAAEPARAHLAAPTALRCQGSADPLAVADPHPRLSWQLRAASGSLHAVRQSAWQIRVADSRAGLLAGRAPLWDSGKALSAPEAVPAALYSGQPLQPLHVYWWQVRTWDENGIPSAWSQPARWTQAPLWRAQWIAAHATDAQAGTLPLPLFRKGFRLDAPVKSAVLTISGLGQYEAHINGRKVGSAELTPGWSDYRKTVFYSSYDVTRLLRTGPNTLGVLLGNGMYRIQHIKGRYTKFEGSYGPPKLIAQLHIELANGKTLLIATNPTWKTAPGPIAFTSIYGGEDYDARLALAGWDTPAFDDSRWSSALAVDSPGGQLQPELAPPIRVLHTYKPIHQSSPKPGVTVYDLAQNFAGWPSIAVSGQAGATVKLIPGELLAPDGTVSQRSSGSPQWFTYTLRGGSPERWHPLFSYYGFRYLQVETTGVLRSLTVEGQAVHSSSPVTGNFASSSDLLNRIHALIVRATENNAQSLLTDCPHREKLGWLEQDHLLAPSILYDFDFSGIYAALAQNLADVQNPQSGRIPEIAPQYVLFDSRWGPFDDSPEWGSAAVLAPWYLYQRTGDLAALLAQRDVMRRYVDYLSSRAHDGIVAYGLGDWYDIGPGNPGFSKLTTLGLTATATYYQDLCVLSRVLALAGDAAASQHYADLAAHVRDDFNRRFFDPANHRYDKGSQTAQAMPLALGLVPQVERAAVLQTLVADIRAHSDHVTAGDIGFHYVVDALIEAGRSDVLLDLLQRTDAPSYGSQLAAGATALTEAWDANPSSSQDHFMLGHAEEWFYRGLGGINVDLAAPAGSRLLLAPQTPGNLRSVRTHYDSAWGRIESNWQRSPGGVVYTVAIPVNATATFRIPAGASLLVNGLPPTRANGVLRNSATGATVELVLASGNYTIATSNKIATRPTTAASGF